MLVVFAHSGTGSTVATLHRGDGVVLQLPGYDRRHRVPHDLAHFATERTLGMPGGVFGSIAAGAVFSNMRLMSGHPRHDAAARSKLILDANKHALSVAEALAGVIHHAVETGVPDQALPLARKAWDSRETDGFPWTGDQVTGAVRLLTDMSAEFEATGTVRATWPADLTAAPPPPRGVRRGRRGRT
ncbi:hypothetical protein [Actinoplanes utahensis]|uniref:Uncharacterized protein n=1 Tax=Actinoplanes utahensis TaxID=1869 RepID=A0A0A6UAS7_ACTUT|nr:hypothetical protein [Actinoplanes utahensis]KHD72163.1 hypothetical protein MB27_41710 [Actinoplanes utahensis]GIF27588.1 hypothetical protein Aut01nite_05740 [Actinoplanes utahensis]